MELRSYRWRHTPLYAALISALVPLGASAQATASSTGRLAPPSQFTFSTVANMGTPIPGSTKNFNSFNQPSVNSAGLVVLRGRSKGPSEPVRGVYARQMGATPGPLTTVFDNSTVVPQPNNTTYNDKPTTFTEFPAFPRIGAESDTMVTRGQSQPVWAYTLPDGSDTRAGTSGVYALRLGERVSAMTQLGNAPDRPAQWVARDRRKHGQ